MIVDNFLALGYTAVTTTTSAASTSYIDTTAAGDSNVGDWFVVKTGTTAFTAGAGAPEITFQLQTSSNATFSGARTATYTLCESGVQLVGALTASKIVYKVRIPPTTLRYIRGYYNIGNYAANTVYVSACSYQMFIVKDADINQFFES